VNVVDALPDPAISDDYDYEYEQAFAYDDESSYDSEIFYDDEEYFAALADQPVDETSSESSGPAKQGARGMGVGTVALIVVWANVFALCLFVGIQMSILFFSKTKKAELV